METIATYSERQLDGRRQYSLYPQEILVVGSTLLGSNFEAKIPLKTIEPTVSRLFTRSTFFLAGVCLATGCTFVCVILAFLLVPWSFFGMWVFILFGIAGFVLVGLTFKKIEFALFSSQAGVRVLAIARSGPERHKFDGFVEALTKQIQTAKAAN